MGPEGATRTVTAWTSVRLAVPPVPRIVPDGVFDAFAWCRSDKLDWRRPAAWDGTTSVTASNPSGLAFVFRTPCEWLPREIGALHVPSLAGAQEWVLAPYAIDDATDGLHATQTPPGDLFSLAAAHLAALAWGLHDWAHFHNHGPFDARAWTELQCDAAALVWLWANRGVVGLDHATWERTRRAFLDLSRTRFVEEGGVLDETLLEPDRLRALSTEV